MNFPHSLEMADLSLSVKLLASAPKLCCKYFIVSRNITWLPVFAKFISAGCLPPILISFVLQTPALRPFKREKKSNLKRLWATTVILDKFLEPFDYNSYERSQ